MAPGKSAGKRRRLMENSGAEKIRERTAAIEVRNLEVELGGVEVLKGVNARFREGEITALIGPNGAGKTTLLLAIMDMVPYRGEVLFQSRRGRPAIGYVPQQLDFDRGLPVTVMDFLCLSRQRLPVWISHRREVEKKARETLALVEAGHLAGRRLGSLSGGELQRTLLAMALSDDPEIMLLDEPASAVDKTGEEMFMKLVKGLQQERKLALVMVSHDLSMVTKLADQVICLNRQVLNEGKVSDVLTEQTLAACFGADKGLLLHDHHWGAELSCASEPPQDRPGPAKGEPERTS